MKIKKSYNTTKYYKGNKKISKIHGIIFMIIGFIILAPLLNTFGRFALYMFYEPPVHVDCDREDLRNSFADYDLELNHSIENNEKLKNEFYKETDSEERAKIYKKWQTSLMGSLTIYQKMKGLTKDYQQFFDRCYDNPISDYMKTRTEDLRKQNDMNKEASTKISLLTS